MLKFAMQMLDDKIMFPYRYGKLTQRISPLLDEVTSILDVGTGDGHLAHHLIHSSGCSIVGLDVCLQPHSYIEVHPYDGRVFPFKDNSFDCVMMVDMLHHTTNINEMVSEACRVARRFVLIKDHYWNNRLDKVALHVADYLGNIPYNVPLPYNYLRLDEWEKLFYRHNLGKVSHATFKYNRLEPAHHIMVKLQIEKMAVKQSVNGNQAKAHHKEPESVENTDKVQESL